MTADEITKEEAAKYIKLLKQQNGSAAMKNAFANILHAVFTKLDEVDLSGIELEDGEADEIFEEVFDAETDFDLAGPERESEFGPKSP